LTLTVGCQEGHLADKNPIPLLSKDSLPDHVEEQDGPRKKWLTQIHLKKTAVKWE